MTVESQTTHERKTGPADSAGTPADEGLAGTTDVTSHDNSGPDATSVNEGPIVFFDGVCGLCNHFVDFVLKRDKQRRFRFAPLQGETAEQLLDGSDTATLKTLVLLDETGTYRRSTAVLRVMRQLGAGWRVLAGVLWLIPRPLRDVGYGVVSKIRYLLFGKKESCRMPTPEERGRLLP